MQTLTAKAVDLGVTRFTLMLTAFRLSLHAVNGQADQCIGIPVAARDTPEREQGVGCYVNLLASRTCIIVDEPWQDMVRRIHAETLWDLDNLQLPFRELSKELLPAAGRGGHGLFDVLFAYQNLPSTAVTFTGLHHELARIRLPHGQYVLDVEISPGVRGGDSAECNIAYAADVLAQPRAVQLAEQFTSQLWRLAGSRLP